MSEPLSSEKLVAKFKRGQLVRWNALCGPSEGWIVQGLENNGESLLPIYRLRKGNQIGSAVETEIEAAAADQCGTCGAKHVPGTYYNHNFVSLTKETSLPDYVQRIDKCVALADVSGLMEDWARVRFDLLELDRSRRALRGIASCSTCGACQNVALEVLGTEQAGGSRES